MDALNTFQQACNALIDACIEHEDREMTWAGINAQNAVLDVLHDRITATSKKDGETESCPAA
jgi:hypothetical protein